LIGSQYFRDFLTLISLAVTITFISCQPDEEKIIDDPSIQLSFSEDTILFDTVFTTIGSITKRFKIYNDRGNAVRVRSIYLGQGINSPYTITVNGLEGKSFDEQIIFGKDSMLVLVKVLIDPSTLNMPFIVEDSVVFETAGYPQNVKLLAWGQNANFLNDSIIVCNTTWNKDLPYVIINSALVDANCTLTIESGSAIYFHNNSSLFVAGTLSVEGSNDQRILFTNDRLDEPYRSTPGQWNGIYFLEGSANNKIDYAIIKNATYGIWLGTPDDDTTPDLEISNSIIENISNTGLIAFTSDLSAYNLLINNCGEFTLANLAGGNYDYTHLTLANFGFSFFRNSPSVAFSDNLDLSDGTQIKADLNVSMVNSIIWGNLQEELLFNFQSSTSITSFHHNLVKTQLDTFAINNLINTDPLFINPEIFNYKIDSLSPAINAGVPTFVTFDLDGRLRNGSPDIGAYEIKN
jgi:hypothetical protein